jgi:hypothetical protein
MAIENYRVNTKLIDFNPTHRDAASVSEPLDKNLNFLYHH